MKNLTPKNIATAVNGKLITPENYDAALLDKEISGVCTDNRKINKGELFIPIKGERVDAHDFIPKALEDGAALTLSERELQVDLPYILVEDTKKALRDLAAYYREQLTIPVIGIIGSVGKTSTKEMTASVLSQHFNVLKTEGNFNNDIGLPLTLFRIRDEHEVAVCEMGISDFGEMSLLGSIAKPNMVIMTNIGECHLENLGDRDGVLKAKTEVFDFLKTPATIILNGDDDKLSTVHDVPGAKIMFYGIGKDSKLSVRAKETEPLGMDGVRAVIDTEKGYFNAEIPIPGIHTVYNAMAATCAGLALGMDLAEIESGIENVKTIDGRSNFIKKDGITVIDDCYNANPRSMRASLEVLSRAKGRKIAVLGDMGELGANEKELHHTVGEAASENRIDLVLLSGPLSKEIEKGVRDSDLLLGRDTDVRHFETKQELIDEIKKERKEGDTILVKASHFMEYGEIVSALVG